MVDLRTDDSDIDALIGATTAKVGPSPSIAEASARLNAMIDAARGAKPELIDPRGLPVRFSRLRQFYLSAAHYHHAAQETWSETLALRMGAGFHASLFANKEVVCYDGDRRGKPWERFKAAAEDRRAIVLNEKEYAVCTGMVDAVRRHDRAMELLFDGTTTEQLIEWTINGRACRATPDARVPGKRIVELKSARSTEPRWFKREALRRHYHAQLAWYGSAALAHDGRGSEEHYIVAVENVAPFNVVVLRVPETMRDFGVRLCAGWFEQLLVAEATGIYAGYVETEIPLEDDRALEAEEDDFKLTLDGEELSL